MIRALFFIGPTKTSTTSIWHGLKEAGVRLPTTHKETFFFDRYYRNDRAAYLRQHFLRDGEDIVEVSPSYFAVAGTPSRIWEMFPDARVVITLREPIARTISLYRHLLRYGWIEDMGIAKAIETVPADLFPGTGYREGLMRWLSIFSPKNVLILKQNEEGAVSDSIFPAIAEFSGIPGVARARLPRVRHNRSMAARSQRMTKLSSRLSLLLRQHNAASAVALAKRLGLGKLLYKENNASSRAATEQDFRAMNRVLAGDIELYERIVQEVTHASEIRELVEGLQDRPIAEASCGVERAPMA